MSLLALGVDQRGGVSEVLGAEPEGKDSNPEAVELGAHQGRLLRDGNLAVEIAIFETGTPPEFRVWVTEDGKPVEPRQVGVTAILRRLGGKEDRIGFTPENDYLRGDSEVREPHSFNVTLNVQYKADRHHWQYDSIEGRTRIDPEIAQGLGIKTTVAGPAVLRQHLRVYGKLVMQPEAVRVIRARFDGKVDTVRVRLGERVAKGQPVIAINSNENLKTYTINAPISGVVLQRTANAGEQSAGRDLLVIGDDRALLAELEAFPATRRRVRTGDPVSLSIRGHHAPVKGVIQAVDPTVRANQASTVRVALDQPPQELVAGSFVSADIQVAQFDVALAVQRSALQRYRDFTVVYEQVGDEYEVRMVELGREGTDWVEVLAGLDPGARYVSENSYIIKADIEKSGAAHDH